MIMGMERQLPMCVDPIVTGIHEWMKRWLGDEVDG